MKYIEYYSYLCCIIALIAAYFYLKLILVIFAIQAIIGLIFVINNEVNKIMK